MNSEPSMSDLLLLKQRLREFAQQRDWEQFHTPKNLAMALIVETAELLEHFQWLTPQQSLELVPQKSREVAMEMADVLIYLIRLADQLDIDLKQAALDKISINEQRFPVDKVHGKAGIKAD